MEQVWSECGASVEQVWSECGASVERVWNAVECTSHCNQFVLLQYDGIL